jgi:hypothetical protein
MAAFQYTPSEDDVDRACLLVDDTFDISLLRTEEGLIIDVYRHDDESELLGTLALEHPGIEEACHDDV